MLFHASYPFVCFGLMVTLVAPRIPQAPPCKAVISREIMQTVRPHRMSSTNVTRDVERSSRQEPRTKAFRPLSSGIFYPSIHPVRSSSALVSFPTASSIQGRRHLDTCFGSFWGRERCSSILLSFGRCLPRVNAGSPVGAKSASTPPFFNFFRFSACCCCCVWMAIPALRTLARFEDSLL